MLIRFNVKNVLSFAQRANGQSEEFSMITGKVRNKKEHIYDDGKIRLLKLAAVYGANAAGKSNLVKAMDLMRKIILHGLSEGHTEKYCKTAPHNIQKPSYFEMEILLSGRYFSYGFEIILSQSRFISEWLVELHANNTENILFTRDLEKGTYEFGDTLSVSSLKDILDIYAGDIANDASVLFLTLMNTNKKKLYDTYKEVSVIKEVFDWFRSGLDINYPDLPVSDYTYLVKAEQVDEVCRIISAFGTGITDFRIVDVTIETALRGLAKTEREKIAWRLEREAARLRAGENAGKVVLIMRSKAEFFMVTVGKDGKTKCQTIEFRHGKDSYFNLSEESDGTVRLLDLLEILLAKEGKTYVIDELDRCLHPSLTYKFIDTYLRLAKKKNIQLIVTTHESRLLDFELLRRDEIWFVDKKNNGESSLYSLEEYNARFDKKIDKAYMEGRYGGVPIFSTIFPVNED